MTTNPLPATPNRTEQARTRLTVQHLPTLTNTNHPNTTISCKAPRFPHSTAREKFPSNHRTAAGATPHPIIEPPTNAAVRQRTRANTTEQARTTIALRGLPKPTKPNHPDRTIACKTRRILRCFPRENFLANHLPADQTPAHPNNTRPDNPSEPARTGRVA